jgi:hypothetical protein
MSRATRTGCALLLWGVLSWVAKLGALEGRAGPAPHVYLADGTARAAVERAILGAETRLGRSSCREIFTDFTDESGHALIVNLEATGRPASDYLVERIWFVDGSETPQCTKNAETVAFTAPGYKVVHVCGAHLARLAQQTTTVEVLVIHELLHTLGLGENPPSSLEITRRVTARCGGS